VIEKMDSSATLDRKQIELIDRREIIDKNEWNSRHKFR
jgi:hypothetical protein